MSFSMYLVPHLYFPSTVVAPAVPIATNTAAATAVTTATSTITTSINTGVASTIAASALPIALPIAVAMVGILATGMVLDVSKYRRDLKKCHEITLQTAFADKESLIRAFSKQIDTGEVALFHTSTGGLKVRYELEDYIFEMDNQSGYYILTVRNIVDADAMLDNINTLQRAYIDAVNHHAYLNLLQAVAEHGWSIEEDYYQEDGTHYISVQVED